MLLLLLLLHVLFHELLYLLLLLLPDLPVIEAPLRQRPLRMRSLEPRHGTAQGWRGTGEPGEMACLCRWYKTRVFSFMYSCSCGLLMWLVQCIIWPTSPAGTKSCKLVYKAYHFLVDFGGIFISESRTFPSSPVAFKLPPALVQSVSQSNMQI